MHETQGTSAALRIDGDLDHPKRLGRVVSASNYLDLSKIISGILVPSGSRKDSVSRTGATAVRYEAFSYNLRPKKPG